MAASPLSAAADIDKCTTPLTLHNTARHNPPHPHSPPPCTNPIGVVVCVVGGPSDPTNPVLGPPCHASHPSHTVAFQGWDGWILGGFVLSTHARGRPTRCC